MLNRILLMLKARYQKHKQSYMGKLVIRGSGYSSKAFALVIMTLLSVILVGIIASGLIVDLIYNHTFTINLSDAALFIGAISTMIASIAVPKSWADKNNNGIPDTEEVETLDNNNSFGAED